ncbi:MAG: hypothetical protein ACJAZV_002037 [Roseivirga sp.]|jgi:hypothetical protein
MQIFWLTSVTKIINKENGQMINNRIRPSVYFKTNELKTGITHLGLPELGFSV